MLLAAGAENRSGLRVGLAPIRAWVCKVIGLVTAELRAPSGGILGHPPVK